MLWPDGVTSEHVRVPMDPSAGHDANLNKLVEQLNKDAEYMKVLKEGLERVHERVEEQAVTIAGHEYRLAESEAISLRRFQERADLRGEMMQRAVHV